MIENINMVAMCSTVYSISAYMNLTVPVLFPIFVIQETMQFLYFIKPF